MKKIFNKILIVALIGSFLFACKKQSEYVAPQKEHAEIVENKYIVKNSHSEYSVVVPKKYKAKEMKAAETLVTYLNKSSGAKLNIIKDNEVSKGSHYISIGNTSQFATTFNDVSMGELDKKISSYFISTKDDNIYIYSNPNERGEATVFGACDLLHELINYEYYAGDEIYYTKETDINLRNYKNFFIHPSFDGRSISNSYLINNQEECDNHRILNQYRGTEWVSEIYGHSQVISFVRPQDLYDGVRTNFEAHPEWFTNKTATVAKTTDNQLCWSAGESLEEYVANRFIQFFQKYPDATYFMFGQEDNSTAFCKCEKCRKAMQDFAVNYAGLQIFFMNKVIARTDAWLKENQPGRQVRYVVFAYYATRSAPVIKRDGKWTLANDKVIPHKDLYILYAPISCNFAFPIDNTNFNSETYLEMQQWSEVARGQFMIYFYDTNFRHYFANFYNFGTVKTMYKMCQDLGVSYIYTQGGTDSVSAPFCNMRIYVESKLMWDINQSYEDLVKDFIDHYFYEAAPEIYEYYLTVRDRLVEYHVEKSDGGSIYTSIATKAIYPYSLLRYLTTLFDKAMEKIDHYQEEDFDFYSTLKARIMREYLSAIYLKITLAKAELSDEEKAEMKEIFRTYTAYFGITKELEGQENPIDIDGLFA